MALVGIFLVLATGLVMRFVTPSPLWLDEALSVNIAQLDFAQLIEALRNDGHPALYYLLLGLWIDVFGGTDFAVRSFSGVCAVLTIPLLYRVALRHGQTAAIFVSLFAISSPFLIRYATEARMYALLVLLCCLAWLFVERAIAVPSLARLLWVALVSAALLHTHYWSIYLLVGALITAGLTAIFGSGKMRARALRVGAAIGVGGSTLLVWVGVLFAQLASTNTPWANRARPAEVVIETMHAIGGSNRFEGELLGIALAVMAMLGVLGSQQQSGLTLRFEPHRIDRAAICAIATLGVGGMFALLLDSAFEPRYAAVVVLFLLLFAAKGVALLPSRTSLVVLTIVVLFGFAVAVDELRRDRTQGGEVAELINQNLTTGDLVVFCPDQLGPATRRGLTAAPTMLAYPRGDGHLVNWQNYLATINDTPVSDFVSRVREQAQAHDIFVVSGFAYKGFSDRCETILGELDATHHRQVLLNPRSVFEPMMLTQHYLR